MSILIDKNTRVATQGITGKTGAFHTKYCVEYALGRDCFVAGVTPGKGGREIEGVPVFDSVAEAREKTGSQRVGDLRTAPLRRSRHRRSRGRRHGVW